MEQILEDTPAQCGAIVQSDGSVRWLVWAPKADRVDIVLIDNDRRISQTMTREEQGLFSFVKDLVPNGQRYAFCLNEGPERPDPASRWQPDGIDQPSAVLRTEEFRWSDRDWAGVAREDLVFYELHVGAFTAEGTFDAIIPRLAALRDLGITALELMPVGQFSGARNWGYDGVHPYAPQHSYGGPHGLQRLVDACHQHGLALFVDVVYNHIGPEGGYLSEYGPYFTDHYRTPWGTAMNFDARGSDAVRGFILDNVTMWIENYHVDGLRLDAVHAIYDFGSRHILQDIKDTADKAARGHGRKVHIVAESDLNDVRLLLPPALGGYGLDAQWNDDFHHMAHVALTGERQGYYEDYGAPEQFPRLMENTFVLDGGYSRHRGRSHGSPDAGLPGDRFIVCIQNHDQIGNRARGERLGTLISPSAQRLAASLLLFAPYSPLLFMGEEYGEEHPFQFFCSFSDATLIENVRKGRRREFESFHAHGGEVPDPQAEETYAASHLTWSWKSDQRKSGLRHLYQDLLRFRREWPALRDTSERSASMLPDARSSSILQLVRGGRRPDARGAIQAFFNLTAQPQSIPFQHPFSPLWTSEATHYHGERREGMNDARLLPYECLVFGSTQ